MKNVIGSVLLLLWLFVISGCEIPVNGRTSEQRLPKSQITLKYYEHFEKGKTYEKKKDLQRALDYYKQALKVSPGRSNQKSIVNQSILRVEKKMNLARKYCQNYKQLMRNSKYSEAQKAIKRSLHIWPSYKCGRGLAGLSSPKPEKKQIELDKDQKIQPVVDYKILPEQPIVYTVKKGDIFSNLCQQYYGTSAGYKLLKIITNYNNINAKSLVSGKTILFPAIQIGRHTYRPKMLRKPFPNAQRTTLDSISEPKPTPIPTLIPTPTPKRKESALSYDDSSYKEHSIKALNAAQQADQLMKQKQYRGALVLFTHALEYNRHCSECLDKIEQIKHILYTQAKKLEKKYYEPDTSLLETIKEQLECYEIIFEIDPNYKDIGLQLKKIRRRYNFIVDHSESTTTISRHPTFDSPEEVNINKEFAVQITLTEELMSPNVIIQTPPGEQKPAKITDDGALKMRLTSASQQKEWRIDIVLAASGFKLPKGNTAYVILPQTGDSTPAVFYLKAKPIKTAKKNIPIYATLWHQGTYLAKLSRQITIINPDFRNEATTPSVVGQNLVDSHSNPVSARSAAANKPIRTKQTVNMNLGFKAPDLTLFILENTIQSHANETQIIINSPHLQPTSQTCATPKGLDKWLEHQYRRFAQQGSRAKIIALNPNDPSNIESGEASSHIKGFGRDLYRRYAPTAFKQAFWKLVDKLGADFDSIQILSDNPLLPWEMMRPMRDDGSDERGFMGLEFKIGRWHINPGSFHRERPSQAMAFRKLVVIAPRYQNDENLPQQDMELLALQKIRGYESIGGNLKGLRGLFQKIPQGIIHFAGHGLVKPSASGVRDYVICLEDTDLDVMAWKGMIQAQNDAHPFFFFNACDVGQSRLMANFVDGWAPAVLESGASGYIGALWPLGDRGAANFAVRFYQALDRQLQKGAANVAELLRKTRRRFLQNGDPTFLAYVFYGDPHLRLKRH